MTVGALNKDSEPFAVSLNEKLELNGYKNILLVTGIPRDLRLALDSLKLVQKKPVLIATSGDVVKWRILELFPEFYPEFCTGFPPIVYFHVRWGARCPAAPLGHYV